MKTKICLIITGVMLACVLGTMITLGCLQSNSKLPFDNPSSIAIFNMSQAQKRSISASDAEYARIIKLYNQSFKKSYLSQIVSEDYISDFCEEDTTAGEWTNYNFDTGLFIKLSFASNQKLILARNGATRQLFIDGIIMQIKPENKVQKTYIYYSMSGSYNNNESVTGDSEIFYPIVIQANTSKLYEYIKDKIVYD